jgi:thioredoxin 1
VTVIDQDQLKAKLGSGKAIVADFYADWCGPCRAVAPELETLAAKYGDVEFVKIDTDANPQITMDLGIMSIPTIVHFSPSGDEVARSTGAARAEALELRLRLDTADTLSA